jgi:hypothetical protein
MRRKGAGSGATASGSRHRAWIYCLRMISAQTRSAFAAREKRGTSDRRRQVSAQTADAPRCAAASVTARAPKKQAPREATAATGTATASASAAAKCSAAMKSTAAAESAAATPVASATAMASAATAAARKLHHASRAVFPVEEVECRKTDVGHFFFAENEALVGRGIESQRIVSGRKSGCGCASHQRKAQPSGTQCGHGDDFGPTFPLRSLLHPGHIAILRASVQLSA